MEYTVDFFINKLEAIPENKWCVGKMSDHLGNHCALGHCGAKENDINLSKEARALHLLIYYYLGFAAFQINDNSFKKYPQPTPKQRIIAALKNVRDIVNKQLEEANLRAAKEIINEDVLENALI